MATLRLRLGFAVMVWMLNYFSRLERKRFSS